MTGQTRYVLCIQNDDYPVSLEMRKVYRALSDPGAESKGLIRVVDESGEDYLYPDEWFVPVQLPKIAEEVFSST